MQSSVERGPRVTGLPGESRDDGEHEESRGGSLGLEHRARLLKEQHVGLCYIDTELRYRYVNDRFCAITGLSSDACLGRRVRDVNREVADLIEPQLKGVLETGQPVLAEMIETNRLPTDEDKSPYQHNFTPFKAEDGEIIGVCCVVWDATHRKTVEDALALSERRYRELYESAPDMFMSVDVSTGRILRCNQTLAQTLGYAKERIIGRTVGSIYAPGCDQAIDDVLTAIRAGETIEDAEHQLCRGDGTPLYASVNASPVRVDGAVRFCNATLRDVTEKRQLEMQLMRARRLESIGQLAAGVAHEINTPMQFLGDNLHFLQESFNTLCRLNEVYAHALEAIVDGRDHAPRVSAARRVQDRLDWRFLKNEVPRAIEQSLAGIGHITHIVQAMRELSHPGSREREYVDVNHLIETAIAMAATEWRHVATIERDLDESLPEVACYPQELSQVLLNLIVNAAQAIQAKIGDFEAQDRIRISTARVGGWFQIRVQDTGCGIAADIEDRVFDPFFTTKDVGAGTGQGLAIAHKTIVEQHEGALEFESEPGVGTAFVVSLPLDPGSHAAA